MNLRNLDFINCIYEQIGILEKDFSKGFKLINKINLLYVAFCKEAYIQFIKYNISLRKAEGIITSKFIPRVLFDEKMKVR